jgi:O-acetyl-ADP-ribose deacetylase (regulator of RNase III)
MKIIKGDLIKLALEGQFDVIVHGCNCFRTMGKGIASQIKQVFPEAYAVDRETHTGDASKLGYFTCATVRKPKGNITIVNAYTQFRYNPRHGMNKQMVDFSAIEDVFRRIKETFHGYRIGYPKIGAGLGGGDWGIISKIIDKELEGEDHTLVILD